MFTKLHPQNLMKNKVSYILFQIGLMLIFSSSGNSIEYNKGLKLYYWHENKEINFGDFLSVKIVERIVGRPIQTYETKPVVVGKKFLALGSILYFAREGDVVWSSGINGKRPYKHEYQFTYLDVRSVRGPLTRAFLKEKFNIDAPEIYGDPALLFPYLFPEFKKSENPSNNYIVVPNYNDEKFFPRSNKDPHIVYPTDPWDEVIKKILDSQFVIASSLHGIIIAEAYGIPARLLRISENEPLFKYQDYYFGTNRPNFSVAYSIQEALMMGGEIPFECDLKKLYEAFPFEYWPDAVIKTYDFSNIQ
ncbi:MAG: polysaccharide pyruvyl transferase family protein [Parachlamydiaceae bacterium]|nr:polysaccharide pyruvyl transferase family protein [Parachlamydiaceae bacterium]